MNAYSEILDGSCKHVALLEQFDTPTLCNAIERFKIRSRTEGFTNQSIGEIIPLRKTFIGFASTGKISSAQPADGDSEIVARKYFESLAKTMKPAFAVIEDIDPQPIGSFWGEVNVAAHRALGCIGVVTSGGVRDLNEVSQVGFGYYANCVVVSHAYVHLVDYNCPVTVGGLRVNPGDLIAADQHGVLKIPIEVVPKLVDECRKTMAAEFPILQKCNQAIMNGTLISVDEIMEQRKRMYHMRNSDTL